MATIPKFVWFEYVSGDAAKAQAFFGEVFNWNAKQETMADGPYTMLALGETRLGGYLPTPKGAPAHAHWLSYLQVADAQAVADKVKSLGGSIAKPPSKIGDFATTAVVKDPWGAVFALWAPMKPEADGGDFKGLDGTWVWNELYTDDPDAAVKFYTAIGGFEHEAMKMGGGGPGPDRYDILKSDGKGRAGIMKLPGVPTHWMPYVKVANTDATVEKAKRLGATFKMPAETVPGVGRLAVLIDPLGAPLGLLQPSPEM